MYWWPGVLVYWCTGVLVYWCTGVLVYWCTGVLVAWWPGGLVYWCTGVLVYWLLVYWLLVYWWPGGLVYWCTGVLVAWCTGRLVYWSPGVLVAWCTGGLVYWSPVVLVYWCTGVLVAWCLNIDKLSSKLSHYDNPSTLFVNLYKIYTSHCPPIENTKSEHSIRPLYRSQRVIHHRTCTCYLDHYYPLNLYCAAGIAGYITNDSLIVLALSSHPDSTQIRIDEQLILIHVYIYM